MLYVDRFNKIAEIPILFGELNLKINNINQMVMMEINSETESGELFKAKNDL